ncbi:MAG: HAD family phosphatase [Maricaulis sp.]|uniref:HAD family hydrolase n=1 Tax=Maricaulis sp. TaxID=1486257 RepID=UPI002616D880|nr:HAD family phosphatase [Maricaulis sp.]MDM7983060.1 HAD family phosphatase [Maricaulis sp.]
MLKPFRAVVFDMDGTLLDTENLYLIAMKQAAREFGHEMTDALHRSQVGVPNAQCRDIMLDALGKDFPFDAYNTRMHAILDAHMTDAVPVKPGVFEMMDALDARGIAAAVATSTSRQAAPERLKRVGLLDRLQTLVTRCDVSNGKPHPEPFLRAASQLGVHPSDCLALEDSFTGVRAAHAAGMQTVMIPDLIEPIAEIEALCQAVMADLHAVREAAFG